MRGGDDEKFHIDICGKCNVVWFEGGELARIQIHFERSAQEVESLAREQRAARLDTDDDDEFERKLAALPKYENDMLEASEEVVLMALSGVLLIASILLGYFDCFIPTAVTSALGAERLALLVIPRTSGSAVRRIALAVIATCEVGFLGWLFVISSGFLK